MTFEAGLRDVSDEAICETAHRFVSGKIDSQNLSFAPSVAQFCSFARNVQEAQALRARPAVPAERRIEPYKSPIPGEKDRMRLKVPMLQAAWGNPSRMNALASANAEGFEAMAALAQTWGVPVPQELFGPPTAEVEKQWDKARRAAWVEIEANPPPYLRNQRKKQSEV